MAAYYAAHLLVRSRANWYVDPIGLSQARLVTEDISRKERYLGGR
jgi:hypothetical protein